MARHGGSTSGSQGGICGKDARQSGRDGSSLYLEQKRPHRVGEVLYMSRGLDRAKEGSTVGRARAKRDDRRFVIGRHNR
jgi:hypothetical protein